LNILIIGSCSEEFCSLIKNSKYSNKIYTACKTPLDNVANIEYQTIEELCQKAKVLKIDIAILMDKNHVKYGINEIFKKHRINLISANQKWFHLETSRIIAKQLVNYYLISTPRILKTPLSFPIIIKTDCPKQNIIANSMEELISAKEGLKSEKTFLEEYYEGKVIEILSLWDEKTLLLFIPEGLSEVQVDRLDLYKNRLNKLLFDEKADFIGFFTSKLIWHKNDWHFLEFKMGLNEELVLNTVKKDIVYLINSAIYQKLHEYS